MGRPGVVLAAWLCLAAASAVQAQAVLADFTAAPLGEPPGGWKLRGTNGGSSQLTVEKAPGGNGPQRCLQLAYDLAPAPWSGSWLTREGRNTAIMGCWIQIPADHWVLELDLEGDGSGHGLVVSVGEPGEWFDYDLGLIDFTGRRTLRCDLRAAWRGNAGKGADGVMQPPLWLCSLNVEQRPEAKAQGMLRLLAVRALPGPPQGLSGLSAACLLPPGGGFLADADVAPQVLLENLTEQELAGTLRWRVRCLGQEVTTGEGEFRVAAQGRVPQVLELGELPVGYYEADVTLECGEDARTIRRPFAVLPPPRYNAALRLGAGEAASWAPLDERFVAWLQTLAQLGGAWTIAGLPMSACEGPGADDELTRVRALLEGGAPPDLAIIGTLEGLPEDLLEQRGSDPDGVLDHYMARHCGGVERAGRALGETVSGWLIPYPIPYTYGTAKAATFEIYNAGFVHPHPPSLAEYVGRLGELLGASPPEERGRARIAMLPGLEAGQDGEPLELPWPDGVGLLLHVPYRDGFGVAGTAGRAAGLQQQAELVGIMDGLWLDCPAAPLEAPGWDRGRQSAEGAVRELVQCVHGAPAARILYGAPWPSQESGGLISHEGDINPAGVAFAICAHLLVGAEPDGEVQRPECRGYLFRSDRGRVAVLWPQPVETAVSVPLQARGTLEHFGAIAQYPDVPAGATKVELRPGANLLRGDFGLGAP